MNAAKIEILTDMKGLEWTLGYIRGVKDAKKYTLFSGLMLFAIIIISAFNLVFTVQ